MDVHVDFNLIKGVKTMDKKREIRVPDKSIVISFIVPIEDDKSGELNFQIQGNGKFITGLPVDNKKTALCIGRRYYYEIPVEELKKLLTTRRTGNEVDLDTYIDYQNGSFNLKEKGE